MLHLDYSMNNEHAMIRLQATLAIAQHTGRAFAFSRGPDQRTRKCFPERESPPIKCHFDRPTSTHALLGCIKQRHEPIGQTDLLSGARGLISI